MYIEIMLLNVQGENKYSIINMQIVKYLLSRNPFRKFSFEVFIYKIFIAGYMRRDQ